MAIALVGTPTTAVGASVTATTLSITVPTGSTGDLLLIGVSTASNAGASATAPLITSSSANMVRINLYPGTTCEAALFYRFVQSGDPSSYTFTVNAGAPYGAVCARYSGVDSTTPFRHWNNTGNFDTFSGATTTSITFPVSENVQSTDLTVVFGAMATTTKTTSQTTALSTPASWTNVVAAFGATNAVTSSYHTAMALYSRAAGVDNPSITGATGHYTAIRIVLIDSSSRLPDALSGTISYINSTTAATTTTSTGTLAINVPSGVVNGHLLLLFASDSTGQVTFTPPAGWTSLGRGAGKYSQGTSSLTADSVGAVWYRFANSEPASYTMTRSVTGATTNLAELVMAMVAYSGVRNPYPTKLNAVTQSTTTASTTTVAPYALTEITADNLVVNAWCVGVDAAGNVTLTGPSSPWNQRASVTSTVASDFNTALVVSDKLAAADQPTATTSVATTSVVLSLTLVGVPSVVNSFARRLGPNYRR